LENIFVDPNRADTITMFVAIIYLTKEINMANPLGIVARLTRPVIGTASDYFKKFDYMMKQGNVENITERCFG
jgi:hypothetical protein